MLGLFIFFRICNIKKRVVKWREKFKRREIVDIVDLFLRYRLINDV